MDIYVRKLRSVIKICCRVLTGYYRKAIVNILDGGVDFGKNVFIGKSVTLKTTDGGSISIGDNVSIENNSYIYAQQGTIRIGRNVFIGSGAQIVCKRSVIIGNDALIAAYVVVRDANHGMRQNELIRKQECDISEVHIGEDVWLGAHVVVTAGAVVGDGAVVGANAVVVNSVEPFEVVGGVPAKHIRYRHKRSNK